MSFPRFWVKVNKNGPIPHDTNLGQCWQWTAGTDADGYGRFGFRQGDHYINKKAHRIALWKKEHKKIGTKEGYTVAEIKEYGEYITLLAKAAKRFAKED